MMKTKEALELFYAYQYILKALMLVRISHNFFVQHSSEQKAEVSDTTKAS